MASKFTESQIDLDLSQLDLDQELEVQLVAAKGTLYEHTEDKTVRSLYDLNLPTLTEDQVELLKAIIREKWSYSVCFHELDQAIYGLFPNHSDKQLKKIFEPVALLKHVKYEFQSIQSMMIKSLPVISTESQTRTLLLVKNEEEDAEEWVGINTCTIKRVPYLEAFCSNRWGQGGNGVRVIQDVNSETIRLLDLYFSHLPEKELDSYESLSITSLPLLTFKITLPRLKQDLDFLNVKFQALPDEIQDEKSFVEEIQANSFGPPIDQSAGTEGPFLYLDQNPPIVLYGRDYSDLKVELSFDGFRNYPDLEVAGWLPFAFLECLHPKMISNKSQYFLIEKLVQILSFSQFYGRNLCNNLVLAFKEYIKLGFGKKSLTRQQLSKLYKNVLQKLKSSPFYTKNLGPYLGFISKSFFFTKDQKKDLENRAQKISSNTEIEEDHIIDALYTREGFKEILEILLKKEKEEEHRNFLKLRFGNQCPQLYLENEKCTCHYRERATNHGYVDETNWDYECWGAFSAGSD